VLEEAGSIVVILRLWRVFKIVEEFSAGASDEMDHLTQRNEKLEKENSDLKRELKTLKANEDGQ
jgi:cell division protein FtsB